MPSIAGLTDPEVHRFLTQGTRTGKLGWTARDGRPLVAPVWFVVRDGALLFTTESTSAKGRSLARDPRAVLTVDLEEPPYAYVQVQGEVTFIEDPDELLRGATDIARRYMGADLAERFGRRNAVPGEYLVRLHPTKVLVERDVTG